MTSQEYWKKREAAQRKHNITEEKEYQKRIQEIFRNMQDEITKEINGFYVKYARKEGITLAEAKKKVSQLDIEEYARKAAKYVKEKDFSKQANEEMRLYNATMKINRLELLKANIGLEMVSGFDELQQFFEETLTKRAMDEFQRQAGILGATIQDNTKAADALVNASFQNATFSDRVWMYQDMLKAELANILQTGLIRGQHPRKLATHLKKRFGVSQYNAERLMITELARVQTEAQKLSFERNDYEEYQFHALGTACGACRALDQKHFPVKDMMPGENAPPMHPHCRCSTSAYMDREAFDKWLEAQEVNKPMEKADGMNYTVRTSQEFEKVANDVKEQILQYSKLESRWSGKINVLDTLGDAVGQKEWNCDISVINTADDGVIWHEMLHSCSGSYYSQDMYAKHQAIEEASVEFLKQQICKEKGIENVTAYDPQVTILRIINTSFGYGSDLEFGKELFNISLPERYQWLEDKVDQSLKDAGASFEDYNDVMGFVEKLKGRLDD